MLRTTPLGLAFTFLALSFSCSDDNKSEFDGGSGGSSAAGGNAGVGGTLLPPPDGGGARDGGGGARPNTDVDVIITADNAYAFGYGTGSALRNYFGGIENPNSEDIFACFEGGPRGPEEYTVPANDANAGDYLYIIGYADKSTTQGVIAQFSREGADPVYTGIGPWQACATGQEFDLGEDPKGPSRAMIDDYIGRCTRGDLPANSSKGWVTTAANPNGTVAFGEDNTTERTDVTPANPFKIACGIDGRAQWMWYDWDPNAAQSPFIWPGGDNNPMREFLIFRLGAEFIPEPVPE
jgi:hypothetical protein